MNLYSYENKCQKRNTNFHRTTTIAIHHLNVVTQYRTYASLTRSKPRLRMLISIRYALSKKLKILRNLRTSSFLLRLLQMYFLINNSNGYSLE